MDVIDERAKVIRGHRVCELVDYAMQAIQKENPFAKKRPAKESRPPFSR